VRRGAGLGQQQVTFENEQEFSEEREWALKQNIKMVNGSDLDTEPDTVHSLHCLGIECRRLAHASSSHTMSQKRLPPHSLSSEELSILKSSVLAFKPVRSRTHGDKIGAPRKDMSRNASAWVEELDGVNIDSRRLAAMYSRTRSYNSHPKRHLLEKCSSELALAETSSNGFRSCRDTVNTTSSSIDEEVAVSMSSPDLIVPKVAAQLLEPIVEGTSKCCGADSDCSTTEYEDGDLSGDSECFSPHTPHSTSMASRW